MAAYQAAMPSSISVPSQARSVFSVWNILDRSFLREFTYKFGNEQKNLTALLQAIGKTRKVDNRDFYHHESRGKLIPAAKVASASVAAAGVTATITFAAEAHYDSGTKSPLRVGDVWRISASGIEGKILSVDTTTPSAHTADVAPLKSTDAFQPAANDYLLWVGPSEAGEASDSIASLVNPTEKVSNSTTEIHDSYTVSDRAMVEKIEFDFNDKPYIHYKDIDEMERRFGITREMKLVSGQSLTNSTASATSVGTASLIEQMTARAATINYSGGSFDIAKFHEINREIKFNNGPAEYQWWMDIYAFQEIQDLLFNAYPGGAIVWASTGGDEATAVGYGFKSLTIDGTTHHFKVYDAFSPEASHGARPATASKYKDFAMILPMGSQSDVQTGEKMFNVQLTYQDLNGQMVYTWEHGALASGGATSGKLQKSVDIATLCGIEGFALNQGILLSQ